MTETALNTENTTSAQPDPQAMEAIMAKIAKIQKILGFLSIFQALIGVALLTAPLWLKVSGLNEPFAFVAWAPFFLALAYGANFAKKDLSAAKIVFRMSAIAQIGLLLVALAGMFLFALPPAFWGLVGFSVILGGLPGLVIYQAIKEQKN